MHARRRGRTRGRKQLRGQPCVDARARAQAYLVRAAPRDEHGLARHLLKRPRLDLRRLERALVPRDQHEPLAQHGGGEVDLVPAERAADAAA
jgi:hypothetical protein